MEIGVNIVGGIELRKVYSGITLKTDDGELLSICMRDSGFEFNYEGIGYSAQKGIVTKMDYIAVTEDPCRDPGQVNS